MEYKVVPIVPVQKTEGDVNNVAKDFEGVIKKYTDEGWEYIRTESLQIWVNPVSGCFGLGDKPGYYAAKQMIVFKK